MICPYCKRELQSGYIKSTHHLVWSTDKDLGFVNEESGDIRLTYTYWKGLLNGFSVESHLCPDCKIVITPIQKK